MKMKIHLFNLCKSGMVALMILGSPYAFAQSKTAKTSVASVITVSGTVKDASGQAVIGAVVVQKGTSKGAATDIDGNYKLDVKPGVTLEVSCIGYTTKTVVVGNNPTLNIILDDSALELETVVVVGYGTQKKATLTGAVSVIKNEEIVATKNENVVNMLSGKVSGLRVVQNSSEPGQFNSSIDIRGFGAPLVIIDGIPRANMSRLDPEDIESISVLKDGSAAVYGVRAANGVILITTKKGSKGTASISYSGNMTWQVPSNFPQLVGAADWMRLYNDKTIHNVDNSMVAHPYSDQEIAEYANGTKTSTNWRNEVMKGYAPQTQHTLSANGGSDNMSYYVSLGYQNQGSFFTSNPINYDKFSIRSNVSAKVTKDLQMDVNLAGFLDERQSSVYGSQDIIRSMWLLRPTDPVYFNEESGQYYKETWNGGIMNPIAMMDKELTGNNSYKSKWFQSSVSLVYSLPWVKGLSVKGLYSYDFVLNDNKEYAKSYKLYNTNNPNGTNINVPDQGSYKVSRYYYGKNNNLWQAQIAYDNTFGSHGVSALALFENSHNDGDNFYGTRFANMPLDQVFAGIKEGQVFNQSTSSGALYDNANQALVGRLKYDYASKYLAEFAFRYEGSNKFPTATRWGFFPTASAGWRVSEEGFWQSSPLKFINNFKLRASYGETGDDSASTFQFVTGFTYPSSQDPRSYPGGYIFDGNFVNSSSDKGIANNAITWYVSKIFNVGFDAEAWHGLLGVTAEYFRRDRSGLLTTRLGSLPGIVGASLPQENLNSDRTQGFDIELSHRNRIGEVNYQVKGNLSFTRTKTIHYEQARQGNSYQNWRNNANDRYNNIWWGYQGAGQISSWDQIYNNPAYIGRGSILGDYMYEDWNGDGWINDLDVHPLATNGQVPLVNYGITLAAQWKGLDVSLLFQGVGQKYVMAREFLYEPLWAETNALQDFMDRWHPADPNANPYDPATEWVSGKYAFTGSNPNASSTFNIQNAAYLRLKNVEIGYTLPKKWLSSASIKDLRIYVSAYNLLTFTDLKYMDPEFYVNNTNGSGLGNLGYNYPINKTFTVGVNVKF